MAVFRLSLRSQPGNIHAHRLTGTHSTRIQNVQVDQVLSMLADTLLGGPYPCFWLSFD